MSKSRMWSKLRTVHAAFPGCYWTGCSHGFWKMYALDGALISLGHTFGDMINTAYHVALGVLDVQHV